MKKEELDELAKKYNVLDWSYVSSVFETLDGKRWVVQTISDIESLFKIGEGKIVCIYKIEKDGKVRGTIINKESIQLLSN
jgi:hypothetical protein